MRTFIAIDLEEEIKKNISLIINKLDSGHRNVKWIRRQSMHLTIKFLGEVLEDQIPGIESVLDNIASNRSSFSLSLKGAGTFPPQKKIPRVLWIGVKTPQDLQALQFEVETEMEKKGIPKEKRKFHPHLTLGRVKSSFQLAPILAELEKHQDTNFGEMRVKKITLFKSILKPSGAEYSVISEFTLQ